MAEQHKQNYNCETQLPFRSQLDSDDQESQSSCVISKHVRRRFAFVGSNNRRGRKHRQFRTGHWLPDENFRYLAFLQRHRQRFSKRCVRKTGRVFKLMEQAIQTRSSIQCRSHHQKMQLKFPSFDQIVSFLSSVTVGQRKHFEEILEEPRTVVLEANSVVERELPEYSDLEQQDGYYIMPSALEPSYKRIEQEEPTLRLCNRSFAQQAAGSGTVSR